MDIKKNKRDMWGCRAYSTGTLTTDDYMSVVVDEIADDDLSREQLKDLARAANCLVGAYRPSKIKEMKLINSLI